MMTMLSILETYTVHRERPETLDSRSHVDVTETHLHDHWSRDSDSRNVHQIYSNARNSLTRNGVSPTVKDGRQSRR